MYPHLLSLCWQSRKFLEPKWCSLHQLWGDEQPEKLSKYMCRYTSIFLKSLLNSGTQRSWRLAAGKPLSRESEGTKDGYFGFCTSSGLFFDHCWVQSVDLIVDITSDQFGDEEVIITSIDDPRYHSNLEEADLWSEIARLAHRPEQWLQEWNRQNRANSSHSLYGVT
jgi:hypothetical protein